MVPVARDQQVGRLQQGQARRRQQRRNQSPQPHPPTPQRQPERASEEQHEGPAPHRRQPRHGAGLARDPMRQAEQELERLAAEPPGRRPRSHRVEQQREADQRHGHEARQGDRDHIREGPIDAGLVEMEQPDRQQRQFDHDAGDQEYSELAQPSRPPSLIARGEKTAGRGAARQCDDRDHRAEAHLEARADDGLGPEQHDADRRDGQHPQRQRLAPQGQRQQDQQRPDAGTHRRHLGPGKSVTGLGIALGHPICGEMSMSSTIYVRFSNQEQARGNSRERQLRLCQEMIARHGWSHDPADLIVDEGKSAFVGTNRMEGGALWAFEAKAAAGHFRNGHVLVVENLDRISRQGYEAILPFLQSLTSNGVTVAIVDGDRIYRAYERIEMLPVMEAVLKAEMAREESEKKSRRLRAAQAKKVEKAQDYAAKGLHIATTKTVPAWIAVDPQTYEMTLIEARVTVLREIFRLTINGYGTPAIAKRLNERGEPVWSNRGIQSNNGWTVGYLTKLVTNRAVLGESAPMNKPRHGKVTSKNITILNRYPQAIDPVTFARAQSSRRSRKNSSGSWQITHGNLFSGIARCASCGGRMKQEVTVRAGKLRRKGEQAVAYPARRTFSYLKCHNALNRVTDEDSGTQRCINRTSIPYERLENAVLNVALHFAANNRTEVSSTAANLEIEIADCDRHITENERRLGNLVDSFSRTGSPSVEKAILNLETEVDQLRKAQALLRTDFEAAVACHPTQDHIEAIASLRQELESPDTQERNSARVRMKQVFRGVITSMQCSPHKETHVVLGDNAVEMIFDSKGTLVANMIMQQRIFGPDGEPDWNPDDEEALRLT